MATTAQDSDTGSWLQDTNAVLQSAAIHLVLLIAVGLLAATSSHSPRGNTVEVSLGGGIQGGDETFVDDAPLGSATGGFEESVASADALAPTADLDAEAVAANSKDLLSSISPPAADLTAFGAESLFPGTGKGQDGTGGGGPADGGLGPGGGNGDGRGMGKPGASFFGIGGYGQKFVYVVDCSDSMNERGKFTRAKYELMRSLESLSSEQKYYVIFYSTGTYPMDADEPPAATQENLSKTTQWINYVEPNGGTNPLPALLFALEMQPDAIYFLSDGQFDPLTVQEVRSKNRASKKSKQKTIPIHTVAFVDRFAEGLMKMISRNSGGEYRFVK